MATKQEKREQYLLSLKNAYLKAYADAYGQDVADRTQVWYEFGWFYVRQVTKDAMGYVYAERPIIVRDQQLEEMVRRLVLMKEEINGIHT